MKTKRSKERWILQRTTDLPTSARARFASGFFLKQRFCTCHSPSLDCSRTDSNHPTLGAKLLGSESKISSSAQRLGLKTKPLIYSFWGVSGGWTIQSTKWKRSPNLLSFSPTLISLVLPQCLNHPRLYPHPEFFCLFFLLIKVALWIPIVYLLVYVTLITCRISFSLTAAFWFSEENRVSTLYYWL